MKTYSRAACTALWFTGAAALWEAASLILKYGIQDPMASKKVPGLWEIGVSFAENGAELMGQAGITMSYAAAGFAIGALAGIILAVLMSLSGLCEKMLLPYLLFSQMIPILGLAPIVFGIFKDISVSRTVIAAYITFFPVAVNLLSGLKSVKEELKTMMISYASGKRQLYFKLLFPFSLPYLFSGLKISAPMAVTAAILVDTLSSKDGIGYVIIFTLYGGGTAGQFWPALIISAVLGLMSFILISAAEYIFVPWKRRRKGTEL
ncbi:MAG: ABC transporter permease subunit [Bacillota bacterium]|nr:ABC transporter permease subunit [Bacillota bacterium]